MQIEAIINDLRTLEAQAAMMQKESRRLRLLLEGEVSTPPKLSKEGMERVAAQLAKHRKRVAKQLNQHI